MSNMTETSCLHELFLLAPCFPVYQAQQGRAGQWTAGLQTIRTDTRPSGPCASPFEQLWCGTDHSWGYSLWSKHVLFLTWSKRSECALRAIKVFSLGAASESLKLRHSPLYTSTADLWEVELDPSCFLATKVEQNTLRSSINWHIETWRVLAVQSHRHSLLSCLCNHADPGMKSYRPLAVSLVKQGHRRLT